MAKRKVKTDAELRALGVPATYGHLLPDSEEYLRGLLDAFDTSTNAEREERVL